jgi:glycosyltransferase involved in cell wall biosynthesis
MKILFLVPYPLQESPSQRFRFEQYFQLLHDQGHFFHSQSFLSKANWRLFFSNGKTFQKFIAIVSGFLKRLLMLFHLPSYDFVFIHREVAPIGPPIFEWIIAKIARKKIIYDFDDAIWLPDRKRESFLFRVLKYRPKVAQICKISYRVSCGNEYLCDYARRFNERVVLNPTTIDTESHHNPLLFTRKEFINDIVIGWTGSHSTLKYLQLLEPIMQQLEKAYQNIRFVVIADKQPNLNLKKLVFRPWSKQTEIADLSNFDIGIMPLTDDEWAKGKCGFKALQYMAMKIPTICSPVGVNTKIIDHEKNGLLAKTEQEWVDYLQKLITDSQLRKRIGASGRTKVIHAYSVASNSGNFLALFER